MSLATLHNNRIRNGEVTRSETIATVSMICMLASAPLVVAIALMVWGG